VVIHAGAAGLFGVASGVSVGVDEGVEAGVAAAEGDADSSDGGGAVIGARLVADAQAAMRRPTTIAVATRENDERIPSPPDGV
jgi:hypothetical protein